MQYRRAVVPGGTFFFTVVTHNRNPIFSDDSAVDLLRESFRHILKTHPFTIEASVILPDHLHMIWTLPENDSDFSTRWRLIKSHFSHRFAIPALVDNTLSRQEKHEQPIWQRRFWEHTIRDEDDLIHHIEYIHFNPVKHKWVSAPVDWPHTSFHTFVQNGYYSSDWGSQI